MNSRRVLMKVYRILLAVGKDRPGIVDSVSTFLFERGANIEDSRMAVMGGYFSIMTLFSCRPEASEAIKKDLNTLETQGLQVTLNDAEDPAAIPEAPALPLYIDIRAMDHPGIVRKVVHILHRFDVNILSLNTKVTRAPLSGTDLFDLNIEAAVPAEKRIAEIKEALSQLAAEIDLDLSFKK